MSTPEEIKPETTLEAPAKTEESTTNTQPPTYTEMASNAASSAGTAAAGVKDSMFSMFGGGAKKEKKEDKAEGEEDRSGSSKAKKDAETEKAAEHEDGEPVVFLLPTLHPCTTYVYWVSFVRGTDSFLGNDRTMHPNLLKSTSSLWFI